MPIRLFKIYSIFCKIGAIMFGGGASMLPILKAEVVDKRRFTTDEELLNLYAISQCTPGIIAVNIATFLGYRLRGIWGALVATLGVISPAVILITIIATILSRFMDNRYVIYAFSGIRIAVIALIINVCIDLIKNNLKNWPQTIAFLLSLVGLIFLHLSPAGLVIIMGTGAIIANDLIRKRRKS